MYKIKMHISLIYNRRYQRDAQGGAQSKVMLKNELRKMSKTRAKHIFSTSCSNVKLTF